MMIIGHRGARAIEPENTLLAIRAGMECADYIEVDTRLSRDRIPIIMHDALLDRTTDGHGPVGDLPLSALKLLDAGKGELIPTLEEVCRQVLGRRGLFVELKEPGSEAIVTSTLKKHRLEDVWIVSFHPECVTAVKEICPDIRTGLIISQPSLDPVSGAVDFGVQAILPKLGIVTTNLVRDSHDSGILVISWTLNSTDAFAKGKEYGIDGFATDDPCRARDFFGK